MHRILKEERDIVISSRPLEATAFQVENIRMAYVFYESGLSINVMYTIDDGQKRAVGFKLSDGMEVPEELASRFKFATAEVEAGRDHPRLLLRHQERVLTPGRPRAAYQRAGAAGSFGCFVSGVVSTVIQSDKGSDARTACISAASATRHRP